MKPAARTGIRADAALLPEGWAANVSLYWDASGFFDEIRTGFADASLPRASGPVIPGMINAHSHAFQRTLVGRTHRFERADDDFWAWRRAMYASLDGLGPDALGHAAESLYRSMRRAGYTHVCEFHYVHHGAGGASPDHMADALVSAARSAGLGVTLLPVLYRFGGFGGVPPEAGQERFVLGVDAYLDLVERLRARTRGEPGVVIGYAAHSLRAVAADDLREILSHRSSIDPSAPFHIHVAEQPAEVEACVAHYGMRPVEWLLDTATPDEAWCLIHATHVDSEELRRLAATDAVVGLCPTTEADLGDGVFPLPEFLRLGGRFAIGSDANVSVSPLEEIRLLEYVQRLVAGRRNVDGVTGDPGAATRRYLHALDGGRRAAGQRTGRLEPGFSADLVVLDSSHELLRERSADEQLQACVFSADASAVGEVAIAGRFPG